MAASSQTARKVIQVVLALVIVGLVYFLYESITEPYEAILEQERLTEETRDRMEMIRTSMIRYERVNGRFPMTLDSLVMFVRADSALQADRDSLFGVGFNVDSLIFSPRTGTQFELAVNDTSNVKIYRLDDPDSDDYIGSTSPDPTRLNAASWE